MLAAIEAFWNEIEYARATNQDTRHRVHAPSIVRSGKAFDCCWPYPTLDSALMIKVMDHIEQHPDEHDQGSWIRLTNEALGQIKPWQYNSLSDVQNAIAGLPACGTVACFAGRTVLLAGPEHLKLLWEGGGQATAIRHPERGSELAVSDMARELLGLTHLEAARMYAAENSRADLRMMVDRLVAAEATRLEVFTPAAGSGR